MVTRWLKMNKLIDEILDSGCNCRKDATLCAFTYLELLRRQDSKKVFDVSHHYDPNIKKTYCMARFAATGALKLFVPISSSVSLSPDVWDDYFSLNPSTNEVVLAIWEADSTFVFYEISRGLGTPPRAKKKSELLEESNLAGTSSQ